MKILKKTMIRGDEKLKEEDNGWRRWKVEQSKKIVKNKK